jgi:hypothetical protein
VATRAKIYLAGLIAGSTLVAAYEAIVYARGFEPSTLATRIWPGAFAILLVLWTVEDSRARSVIYKPFDFGFLVLFFWLPYLPYYLWRTRRGMGILMFLGFVTLYLLGTLSQLVVYALS